MKLGTVDSSQEVDGKELVWAGFPEYLHEAAGNK